MNICGKVALVTGGASGIGKALVELMLKKQAKAIFIVDVDEDGLKQTQEEFGKQFGEGKVHICKCDVSSMEQMEDCFKNIISTYGELHIVCNNAGIGDEIDWKKMLDVNLTGVIIGTKLAVQYMQGDAAGGGVIINTASYGGLTLHPGFPVYATTKLAVIGFTRQIATFDTIVEKKKIRVNVICPMRVLTPILTKMKVEKEYEAAIANFVKEHSPNSEGFYSPQECAKHFVKLIEEPHHGATLFVETAEKSEFVADEFIAFREHIGINKDFQEICDAALK